jgi:hypothetical protein
MTKLQMGLALIVVGQLLVIGVQIYKFGKKHGIEEASVACVESKQLSTGGRFIKSYYRLQANKNY